MPKLRLPEVDLMRALALLAMIAVHAKMLFLRRADQHGAVATAIELLGGAPAAPAFLFLMGLVWSLKPAQPWPRVLRRALELLALGYALNFLRLTLPIALGAPFPPAPTAETLLMVDILQMAAPALLVLRALEHAPRTALALAIGLLLGLAPLTWGLTPSPGPLDFLWGAGPFVFFPFFPWLAYPLLGLWSAQRPTRQNLVAGALLVAGGIAFERLIPRSPIPFDYYHPAPGQTLWMLGFTLLWRELARALILALPKLNARAVRFLSAHVTSFYVFSWLVLSWATFALGYRGLPLAGVFALIPAATLASVALVALWARRPDRAQ